MLNKESRRREAIYVSKTSERKKKEKEKTNSKRDKNNLQFQTVSLILIWFLGLNDTTNKH